MPYETFRFNSIDSTEIFCYKWLPDESVKIKAVVQIAHGMAEHAERYHEFAEKLNQCGYAVFANDHRGHGKTAGSVDRVGHFASKDGWNQVVEDMHEFHLYIKNELPNIPIFLFGHSMGSYLSRSYIALYGEELNGVILSGTGAYPKIIGAIGKFFALLVGKIKGSKYRSAFLTNLSFGKFNDAFKPNRTDFDWLSRDTHEVDKYIDDPFCGGIFSAQFFYDMLTAVKLMHQPSIIIKIPKTLPIYLYSGGEDPVGDFTKGVSQAYESYLKVGIKDVSIKFYDGGRHEMLKELNREEVYSDVIQWLDDH